MTIPFLIIGQGLAGSLLAWELIQREQRVLVVDEARENSASRVAAGLINPITGRRLVKADYIDRCLPVATACYAQLQQKLGQSFYHPKKMLRLFGCSADKDRYHHRCREAAYQDYLGSEFKAGESGEPINDQVGGFTQQHTGYLDITALLDALHAYFEEKGLLVTERFNYQDMQVEHGLVHWQQHQPERVIFSEGARAIDNPWFRWLPFQLSKGEIMTVQSEAALPDAIINDGHWLLPRELHIAKLGASYDWEWSEEGPTLCARQQLLQSFCRICGTDNEPEVIDHRAGIRPTTRDKYPFLGAHPEHQRLHIFNGFGSKGSLMIPYYARRYADFLLAGQAFPEDVDIARFEDGKSMVVVAKRHLSEHIKAGDIVIDATTGNGHDTEFAARCVGHQGHVFGLDIQKQAIDNTYQRLSRAALQDRVTLINRGHEQLQQSIPEHYCGQISTIIFNLGYLPGDNKQVVTRASTTIAALKQAILLLKRGGMVSIVSYRGHDVGTQEAEELQCWLTNLDRDEYKIKVMDQSGGSHKPFLVLIHKLSENFTVL